MMRVKVSILGTADSSLVLSITRPLRPSRLLIELGTGLALTSLNVPRNKPDIGLVLAICLHAVGARSSGLTRIKAHLPERALRL